MLKTILTLTFLILSLSACSNEKEAAKPATDKPALSQLEQIKQAIPSLNISAVQETPIKGLFELQVGRTIYYSDAEGKYLVSGGNIFEVGSRRNLTRERLEELNRIDWSTLPLDKAIVSGDDNATLKLAVFTDPDCPYCKKLEEELKKMSGVKVYTFLYPLVQLHPQARAKAEAIWCSEDQHDMMLKVMVDKFIPEKATCTTPLDDIAAVAKKLNINGTPTMIAGDGRIAAGGKDATALKAWLNHQ
ncbi:thiol:disulfide interchange protein DsbC [Mariprofundus micogutta]|uniref:Thiol:disulfide interchange protein n=1 Tax=Mariprofundus micogutta TaxID=1921010 RepID=A0A1L8CQV8_9PROT|nr:DsbC family protein [Mariprofundus micogutta]GAV21310.1 thiol:disulfide interchange protein DsbC [Mariprofundus micogutta]